MEPVDFKRFVSAGYFLVRAGNPGWEQLRSDLLPEELISLSDCISRHLNVGWGWIPGNKEAALQFGVREDALDEFVRWCWEEHKIDMDMWSMFYSPEAANRIANRFLVDFENLHVIGVGLPHELEEANWREPAEGREIYPIEKRIEQRIPLAEGGQALGFEVVSFEYGDFGHSWLCCNLHGEMNNQFGIHPGQYGLIQREQDACRVYEWIEEDDVEGHHRCDPVPYDYWLLVDYPLEPVGRLATEIIEKDKD